jgi:uncharacterized protein (DUF2252 family)
MTALAGEQRGRSVRAHPPSPQQRRASGRAAREQVPLDSLRLWDPAVRRQDALATILAQNDLRVAELAPIRAARMSASPWTYYRGAAAVMAADLAVYPHTSLNVQLCGDAHALNFGLWATPERQLSFDLRDFDETLRGPFEWDVKRFAASLVVLAGDNDLSAKTAERALRSALRSYRGRMSHFAAATQLEIWYDLVTVTDLLQLFEPEERERLAARVRKRARRRTSAGAAAKLTTMVDGQLRIVEDPPIRVRIDDASLAGSDVDLAVDVVQAYRDSLPYERRYLLDRFTVVDVVRQVVGVGSVGMLVFLVLLEGHGGGDPLFLQVKQAGPSVYEPYLGASPYPNHGQRVITGKRLIQSATDIFVGWTSADGRDFYVRQFRDMKIIPHGETIAPHLVEFAAQCGAVLARAHARTGDAVSIAAYIGKGRRFDDAIVSFAISYARQNAVDHRQLTDAISVGTVLSAPG